MPFSQQIAATSVIIAGLTLAAPCALGQDVPQPQSVEIPRTATSLEGIPSVRIDSTESGTKRRVLSKAEAAKNRLVIRIVNGQFYWANAEDRPLELHSAEEFTYLSSSEPGKYIKFTRLNDKISYVEHVDQKLGSVTYWGELRVVVGK